MVGSGEFIFYEVDSKEYFYFSSLATALQSAITGTKPCPGSTGLPDDWKQRLAQAAEQERVKQAQQPTAQPRLTKGQTKKAAQ